MVGYSFFVTIVIILAKFCFIAVSLNLTYCLSDKMKIVYYP